MFTGSDWFCHHSGSETSYVQKLRYLPTTLTEPVPSLSGPAPHTVDLSMHRSYKSDKKRGPGEYIELVLGLIPHPGIK